jgi:hypothetical protein
MINKVNVKVDVAARSAFDEITQEMQSIQLMDTLLKFNPNLQISPSLITKIM